MPELLYRLALLLIAVLSAEGAGKLPIVLCTPEGSKCSLASDSKPDTCFSAAHLEENFYFSVFNTVDHPVTVDKLLLNVGRHARTKYTVSLASGSEAHELNCSRQSGDGVPAATVLECPANLPNVTSVMIRSQPLLTRLNLLEVTAFNANGTQLAFSYCGAPESPSCEPARDGLVKAGSPAVVSELTYFPAWYGGLDANETVSKVAIYRPVAASADGKSNAAATFYRVNAGKECEMVGRAKTEGDGVEVLEFRCSGGPSSLLQIWEIDAEYLINLCEVQVYGQ